jgi:hypothetical protein
MTRFPSSTLLSIVLLLAAGCSREITGTPAASAWPPAGSCLTAAQDLKLMRSAKHGFLYAAPRQVWDDEKPVGTMAAGTTVAVSRIVHYKEFVFVILPASYDWDAVFAKPADGPFAGQEVAILGSHGYFQEKRDERFIPCAQRVGSNR